MSSAHAVTPSMKLRSRRAPTAAERSGWNCAPRHVAALHDRGEGAPCSSSRRVARLDRRGIAVDEIERSRRRAMPSSSGWSRASRRACSSPCAARAASRRRQAPHRAGQQAEAGDVALLRGSYSSCMPRQMPSRGASSARSGSTSPRRAGAPSPVPRRRRRAGSRASPPRCVAGVARDRRRDAEALERVAHRAEVRAAGVDDDHAHRALTARPCVLGSSHRLRAATPAAARARRP